jgi:hypothetical protein
MKATKLLAVAALLLVLTSSIGTFFYFKNKFLSAPPNQLTLSDTGDPFAFTWAGQEINGEYEPHVAMFVPVTIRGIDETFYMQFDMGAPSTVLDYNPVKSINEKYGGIFQIEDDGERVVALDVALRVGSVGVEATELQFREMGSTIDWANPAPIIKIGTVGADFMAHHVLSIDFPNKQITLGDASVSAKLPADAFSPLSFDGRKVFLSATLNDEPVSLWFDSGSSAFELIVEEGTFERFAIPGAKRRTYIGKSWGSDITIHNIDAKGEFQFGDTSVPLTYVTYMEWPNKLQAWVMKLANLGGDLGGMTGNKLFLNTTLVLDAPNLRYAVIRQAQ